MTRISSDTQITYQDLIDNVMSFITNICFNIERSYNIETPPGFTHQSTVLLDSITRVDKAGKEASVSISYYVDDPILVKVKESVIVNELNSFLIARGIESADTTAISIKHIINFYNNVAAFLTKRLKITGHNLYDAIKICYNAEGDVYPNTSNLDYKNTTGEDIYVPNYELTAAENEDTLNKLNNSINTRDKIHAINLWLDYACCSSSSSSSSSSSCSSSSSLFIAYMDI